MWSPLRMAVLAAIFVALCGNKYSAAQSLRDARGYPPRRSPTVVRQQPPPAAAITPAVLAPATIAAATPATNSAAEIPIGEGLQQYITQLVVEHIPHEYDNAKKWQGTKKVVSGLDWEVNGAKVETRRQWKEVNHGTWSRYHVKLIDPERELNVRLENLRDAGNNIAAMDLIAVARVECTGRMARWQRGVQLISLDAEATAKVRLAAHLEVKMGFDPRTLPPDILLSPVVTTADLQLLEFELHRVSKADGVIVKQFGEAVEEELQAYLAENREKLAEKMNAQIEKRKDKLRIPLSKLTASSTWGGWFSDFFGNQK